MAGALIIPSIILLVALVTDLKTRKIPNNWVLISIVLALINSYYFFELDGLKQGAIASAVALGMTLPLVLIGALGAGDMKLMFAFGLATTYPVVFTVIVFSFLWAVVVGLIIALFKKRGTLLLMNTLNLLTSKGKDTENLQKIPYTIALVLGWFTYLVIGFRQGGF
jgi:Flp pilus assembly protein protease CpaA